MNETESLGVAIISMAGRFPGAADLEAFWNLIKDGGEAITHFSDEELLAAGVPSEVLTQPNFVNKGTLITDAELFDADFFSMNGLDATIMDPQQRLFLQHAWETLEQAGYPPATTDARIGLYAGIGENSYQWHYLEPNWADLMAQVGGYRLMTLVGKDYMATRTAYKLNLTGPAVTVQTACSTSLVAVHMACQSLLNFECDMALAGGVSMLFPQGQGYFYQEGMIFSPDGHCRAFDAQAQGTVNGGGVGVVMLKRLDEAIADGDTIHAVIMGSAINNDGSDKIGYTAPSVGGQASVILEAQAAADVLPEEISYIEAHGTGTPLGDPIEIEALTRAFYSDIPASERQYGYCAIGSLKTNIGHADTAAGVAGLIKTVLALKHRQLPPSLHFETPNPQIDFDNSPFQVNNRLQEWAVNEGQSRYAGVSSFGIGGTNAHVIVTEAPEPETYPATRPFQLVTLSAKSATALKQSTQNLADWLQKSSEDILPDAAYTLNRGRQHFAHRCMVVGRTIADIVEQLNQTDTLPRYQVAEKARDVLFLFPGQGSQYANMSVDLYETEPLFRASIDECAMVLTPYLGQDLRQLIYDEANAPQLGQTAITQPALFAVEYALAQVWMAWGIQPKAMAGHSIGEYVAACLAGVFSLEDALKLIAMRGQLIQSLPTGAMLAAIMPEEQAQQWLSPNISLAVVNGPERCVFSGTDESVETLQQQLIDAGVECRPLHTSHAFHSHLMEPILEPFTRYFDEVRLHEPSIPYLSNVTGTWITPAQATDAAYWTQHLRQTVRFGDNLQILFEQSENVLLEVGPGQTLYALAHQHPHCPPTTTTLYSLPRQRIYEDNAESSQMLQTLGQLWANGAKVGWEGFYADEKRRRIPLPTYPLAKNKYWMSRPTDAVDPSSAIQVEKMQVITHSNKITDEHQSHGVNHSEAQISANLTPLEAKIATIWSRCLGTKVTSPQADFFELGGDSLLAVQLLAQLRTHLGLEHDNLDVHTLLHAPTIAQLAALIHDGQMSTTEQHDQSEQHRNSLILPFQIGNPDYSPLILIHPAGGHVYLYREFVKHLPSKLPVYAIRGIGIEEGESPLNTIEDMAVVYTEALQSVQPKGPYYLVGSSFGGLLAYAMAQYLISQGETVEFLAMFDTPNQNDMQIEVKDTADILSYFLNVGEDIEVDIQKLRMLSETEQIKFFFQQKNDDSEDIAEALRTVQVIKNNLRAMADYIPSPIPVKLHFFLAKERDDFITQPTAHGWISLAKGGIEIHTVPGNHISMNEEPNIQILSQQFLQCLQQVKRI
ncbi:MAG: alpha/beta fold hydrolase [Chloroflexota bacterium]